MTTVPRVRRTVRIGTRGSTLARRQTDTVAALLRLLWDELAFEIVEITTKGDVTLDSPLPQMGGKGVFTAELEAAMREGSIDIAVHSLKDLPVEQPADLVLGAITRRVEMRDALITRHTCGLTDLPRGATVGTSSLRRTGQLRHFRADLKILDIRGNVDTRIAKAMDAKGPYDAIVLAAAGLERLGRENEASELIDLERILPAPGQGFLAVQCRDEWLSKRMLAPLADWPSTVSATAERAFLAALGGGCAVPVAAYGLVVGRKLLLRGRVIAPDGSKQIDVGGEDLVTVSGAHRLGKALAERALKNGADLVLGKDSQNDSR